MGRFKKHVPKEQREPSSGPVLVAIMTTRQFQNHLRKVQEEELKLRTESSKLSPQEILAQGEANAQFFAHKQRVAEARKSGSAPTHTRGTFAWRENNRKAGAVWGVEREEITQRNDTQNYVPVGHPGGAVNIIPVFGYKGMSEFGVFVKKIGSKRARPRLFRAGFSSICSGDRSCGKKSCACCWAVQKDPPKGYQFVIRELNTPDTMQIRDLGQVHPKGSRGKGSSNWGEDQVWDCFK